MYDPPAYVWALTIGGPTATAAMACIALYGGAERAGLGRKRAALLAGAAAVLLGGWFTATAVIAGRGWYDTRPSQLPWLPIAAAGSLGTLLALSRIPMVARALTAPGTASRLVLPHSFRVTGVFFLLYLAFGHLPALFALPAGLGDIAAGIAAPLVARRLAQGNGRRAAVWFNIYGLTDLATGITLGALTGYGLLNVTPSTAPISQLPLALVIAADVPLMIALHITSLVTLTRAPRPGPSGWVRVSGRPLRTSPPPRARQREWAQDATVSMTRPLARAVRARRRSG
jgi:hypothetical protein